MVAGGSWMQGLELKAYDLGVSMTSGRLEGDQLAVIAIDAKSISELGDWPWPRDIIAKVIRKLTTVKPRAIGVAIDLKKAQNTRGLDYVARFKKLYASAADDKLKPGFSKRYKRLLQQMERDLKTDWQLAGALKRAHNVVLAMSYRQGSHSVRATPSELPRYIEKSALMFSPAINSRGYDFLPGVFRSSPIPEIGILVPPLELFGNVVRTVGYMPRYVDTDGVVRAYPLVLRYNDRLLPSFSLQLAAAAMGISAVDINIDHSNRVKLGHRIIKTDSALRLLPQKYKAEEGRRTLAVDSFADVYNGKIPVSKFRDKVVLLGLTDIDFVEPLLTASGASMAPVIFAANALSSMLDGEYYYVPAWALWAELSVFLIVVLYLVSILPRLQLSTGLAVSAVSIIVIFNAHLILMASKGIWLHLMVPLMLLFIGNLILAAKKMYQEGNAGWLAETAETNRMLGLALQSQGQLDMAFEKFRKCPVDNSVMELLYILGLDYERKRQFAKAGAVFRHISEYNANFRDINKRIMSNHEMEGLYVHGSGGQPSGTLVLNNTSIQKPMLGRYEIIKELGRGAMGMVYQGKDPKIDRIVAIKTLALAQEFEASQLEDVKERFFREAKTAGRLNHRNIVTVYDIGEEHDLAYIAMDYLEGSDLVPYTKADNLLPLTEVLYIVCEVAAALDYAQRENVVHRDIKPANIMYHPEAGKVTVMDFGVACLTDVTNTKTGTVLGTPSYMSPEQLAGQKVDGRSDIFSLGVTLFQLVTGELPFIGDSMANLMFKITNEKQPDIRIFRSEVPSCVSRTVNKALRKEVDKRFQNGGEYKSALQRCIESMQPVKKVAKV